MIKFSIRLLGFILCLLVLMGGAYMTYLNTDFASMKQDFDTAFSAGFAGFIPEKAPDDGENIPDNGGENTPDDGGENTPDNGGENN